MQILGPEKEEVAGEQRNFQNGKLHNLCSSLNIRVIGLRNVRWAGHVARLGDMRNACNVFVGKTAETTCRT